MDIFIILITCLTVLLITYILSKPFSKSETPEEEIPQRIDGEEVRYQAILLEIKALQEENEQFGSTIARLNLIEAKKAQSAELLRLQDSAAEK